MSIRASLRKAAARSSTIELARGMRVRLWPLAVGLLIVLFPFDWLGEVWPWYARIFYVVFATMRSHEIGHATMFLVLGLLALLSVPALLARPALYCGLLLLVAVGQEAIQALAKQDLPTIYDGRDLLVDLVGISVAYLALLGWQRLRLKDSSLA